MEIKSREASAIIHDYYPIELVEEYEGPKLSFALEILDKHCPGVHPLKLDNSFADKLNQTIESVLYENNIIISDWKRGRRSFEINQADFLNPTLFAKSFEENFPSDPTMMKVENNYNEYDPSKNLENSTFTNITSTRSPKFLSESVPLHTNKILDQNKLANMPKIELSFKDVSNNTNESYETEIITVANNEGKRLVIIKPNNTKYENMKKLINMNHDKLSEDLIQNGENIYTKNILFYPLTISLTNSTENSFDAFYHIYSTMDLSAYVIKFEPKRFLSRAIIYQRGLNFFNGNKPLYLNLDVYKPGARTLRMLISTTSLLSKKLENRRESKSFIHVSARTHHVCEARSVILPNINSNFIVETVTEITCNFLIEENLDVIQIQYFNPGAVIARNSLASRLNFIKVKWIQGLNRQKRNMRLNRKKRQFGEVVLGTAVTMAGTKLYDYFTTKPDQENNDLVTLQQQLMSFAAADKKNLLLMKKQMVKLESAFKQSRDIFHKELCQAEQTNDLTLMNLVMETLNRLIGELDSFELSLLIGDLRSDHSVMATAVKQCITINKLKDENSFELCDYLIRTKNLIKIRNIVYNRDTQNVNIHMDYSCPILDFIPKKNYNVETAFFLVHNKENTLNKNIPYYSKINSPNYFKINTNQLNSNNEPIYAIYPLDAIEYSDTLDMIIVEDKSHPMLMNAISNCLTNNINNCPISTVGLNETCLSAKYVTKKQRKLIILSSIETIKKLRLTTKTSSNSFWNKENEYKILDEKSIIFEKYSTEPAKFQCGSRQFESMPSIHHKSLAIFAKNNNKNSEAFIRNEIADLLKAHNKFKETAINQDEKLQNNVSLLQNGTELYFPVINRVFKLKSVHHSWITIITTFIFGIVLFLLFCCCLNGALPILCNKIFCNPNCLKNCFNSKIKKQSSTLLTPIRLRSERAEVARELPIIGSQNNAYENNEI